jgi:tetratricopeptide (TPR) repeat protein
VRRHLERLSKAALVDLVMGQVESDEFLRGRLLLEAAKAADNEVDLESFRSAIENVINVRDFVDYRSMYDYSRGIEDVIDSIEDLRDDHPEQVIELCEHALECLEDAMGRVDDSDGYMGSIHDRLCGLHHSACVNACPDHEVLAARLFEWDLHSEREIFLGAAATYADVLGEEGLATYRRLAEEHWASVPAIGPGEVPEHSSLRFHITYIMKTLAELSGDVDALVAVKSRDLSHAYGYVEIAQIYQAADRHQDALAWTERGLAAFPDHTDVRLREVLADEYHRCGRDHEAVALLWAELAERPVLASYQRLKDHAQRAGGWERWREKALELMRAEADRAGRNGRPRSSWAPAAGRSELVRVFLWEDEADAAWDEATTGGCSDRLWMELATRREAGHPADALPIYQQAVEQTVGIKNNDAYEDAVKLLRTVQRLMDRLGRSGDFPSYLASVRSAHKPKRNFMKLLDKAGW